jgi:hypothetical protein
VNARRLKRWNFDALAKWIERRTNDTAGSATLVRMTHEGEISVDEGSTLIWNEDFESFNSRMIRTASLGPAVGAVFGVAVSVDSTILTVIMSTRGVDG